MIDKLFIELRRAIEATATLKRGNAFLPHYLRRRRLTKKAFRPVARRLAARLGMHLTTEVSNGFPKELGVGRRQIVDYVFSDHAGTRQIFLELESLDRAQLHNFLRAPVHRNEDDDESKLWHYYGTLAQRYSGSLKGPKIFAFLLILPDERVDSGGYTIWDSVYYRFFDRSIGVLIRESPFRFYHHLIKAAACRFLEQMESFPVDRDLKRWSRQAPKDLQRCCELVLLTVTRRELIMSRGRDLFDPTRETRLRLRWNQRAQ